MNILIHEAFQKLREIEQSDDPTDDALCIVVRATGARLLSLDLSIHHTTATPRKLLNNDGTIVTQIVESVRVAIPALAEQNPMFDAGTAF